MLLGKKGLCLWDLLNEEMFSEEATSFAPEGLMLEAIEVTFPLPPWRV